MRHSEWEHTPGDIYLGSGLKQMCFFRFGLGDPSGSTQMASGRGRGTAGQVATVWISVEPSRWVGGPLEVSLGKSVHAWPE